MLTSSRSSSSRKQTCSAHKTCIHARWPLGVFTSSRGLDTQFLLRTCVEASERMCPSLHVIGVFGKNVARGCLSDRLTCRRSQAGGKLSDVSPSAPAPAHEYLPGPKMLITILRWLGRTAVHPHLLSAPFRPNPQPHQLEIRKYPPPASHQYLWRHHQNGGIIYYNHARAFIW